MGIIKNWKLFSNAISAFRNALVSNRFSVYYSDRAKRRSLCVLSWELRMAGKILILPRRSSVIYAENTEGIRFL